MKHLLQLTASCVILFVLAGCSTLEPGKRHSNINLQELKRGYIVTPPNYNLTVSRYIGEALIPRGVSIRAGAGETLPPDLDFLITYEDKWTWDLKMYLESLEIKFLNPTNREVLASGSYHQGVFHGYPDLQQTVEDVIQSIYSAK